MTVVYDDKCPSCAGELELYEQGLLKCSECDELFIIIKCSECGELSIEVCDSCEAYDMLSFQEENR